MYDSSKIRRYVFIGATGGKDDFGGGTDLYHYLLGPKGKKGTLVDYGVVDAVEAFAAGTATPMVAVGTAADQDAYGEEFDCGAFAVAGGQKSVRTTYRRSDTGHATYILNNGELPADTVIKVTSVAGTGSGLTGQANSFVEIIWDD